MLRFSIFIQILNMKRFFLFATIAVVILGCRQAPTTVARTYSRVHIEPLLQDSTLSIRALEVLDKHSLAFAANHNTYGLYHAKQDKWLISKLVQDSLDLEFRAIANNNKDFFMLSIAQPALLYKTDDSGKMKVVYSENNDQVFYDAMAFWNDKEGLAIGDPTDGCMSIIITRDGGHTWDKLPCGVLPKAAAGEAAFAASNTNIAIVGNHTWVATGGTVSQILYSANKGHTWQAFETPIIQGTPTTGIYSIDFYDDSQGFAIGGDYTQPEDNSANKMLTSDGGKTWQLVGQNKAPGYRSCVQYVPNGNGNALVVVGQQGIDYSNDGGLNWKSLSNEGFYTLRFLNDSIAFAAGKGRISKLTFK